MNRVAMIVIKRPRGWKLKRPGDMPKSYRPERVEFTTKHKRRARLVSHAFNAASLNGKGKTWSVIVPILGKPLGKVGAT